MASYTCPLCQKQTPHDVAIFLEHAERHIIEKIRQKHPEWEQENGACQKCVEYYKAAKQV